MTTIGGWIVKKTIYFYIYIYIHIYIYKYIYIPDAGPYIHISSITLYLYMYSIESLDQFPSPVSHFFRQKPRFGACAASTTHCTCCRGVSSARKAAFCATVAANSACCLGVLPLPWCGSGMMVSGMPCSCWAAVCILSIYIYRYICRSRYKLHIDIYIYMCVWSYIYIPVVPHKAVAEVSKIGNL